MKILVTGGAGFIGSHLVNKLVRRGNKVTVLDDLSSGNPSFIHPASRFIRKSITDNLSDIFAESQFECVFHLAAQTDLRKSLESPEEDARINVFGSQNLIQQAIKTGVKRFIFSSSAAVYSQDAGLPCIELSETCPATPYGKNKLLIEKELQNSGLHYVILRYSNVYGPRQGTTGEAGVVSIFIKSLLHGKQLTIFGTGEQTRDFIYVADVIDANFFALELSQGVYNVSTSREISVNQLVSQLETIAGIKPQVANQDANPCELQRSCLSSRKLESCGWQPKYQFKQGLKETISYFKNEARTR